MPSSRLTTTCRCRRRLAVGPKGDVAEERDDLDLLGDGNFPVVLRLPIEETEHRIAAGADAGELGGPRSLPPPDRRVRFCPFSTCALRQIVLQLLKTCRRAH
jgi:hypothetical protein